MGGGWSTPTKITTVSTDPAASAQNNLQRQFMGDYNTLVSDTNGAWFIFTDSRNGVGCADVDAYQAFLVATAGVRGDMADRLSQRQTGVNPALSDPSEKPAPPLDCPSPHFGDTDAYVMRYQP